MNTKNVIVSFALATAFTIAPNLHAATSTNSGLAEGVTVETGGAPLEAVKETPVQRDARMAWWREARFGMFVHWGLYSGLAGTWDGKPVGKSGGMEWIQQRVKVDTDTYAAAALPKFQPKHGYSLALWESADGFDWKLAKHPFVANPGSIRWADGHAEKLTTLERPQLLFENGEPVALSCAAANNKSRAGSFNVQIPLKTKQ